VVGGVIGPMTAPRALLLGRLDVRGRLRVAGRTIPLPWAASAELAAVLSSARDAHPWPAVIPSGRVGLPGGDPVSYTPVRPEVVVELSVDTAQEWGRWRHAAVYQRLRLDLQPEDLI
jgi:hypothetical protein